MVSSHLPTEQFTIPYTHIFPSNDSHQLQFALLYGTHCKHNSHNTRTDIREHHTDSIFEPQYEQTNVVLKVQ